MARSRAQMTTQVDAFRRVDEIDETHMRHPYDE